MATKPKNWSKEEWTEYKAVHAQATLTSPRRKGGLKGGVPGDYDIHSDDEKGDYRDEDYEDFDIEDEKGPGPLKGEIVQKSVSRWMQGLPMPSLKRVRAWRIINVILENGWVNKAPMNNINNWKIYTDKKAFIEMHPQTGKPVYQTHIVWKGKAISKIPDEVKASGLYMVKKFDRMYLAKEVKK